MQQEPLVHLQHAVGHVQSLPCFAPFGQRQRLISGWQAGDAHLTVHDRIGVRVEFVHFCAGYQTFDDQKTVAPEAHAFIDRHRVRMEGGNSSSMPGLPVRPSIKPSNCGLDDVYSMSREARRVNRLV